MAAKNVKVRFRQGDLVDLPTASSGTSGEPRFCIDTGQLFVDDGVQNIEITPNATNISAGGGALYSELVSTSGILQDQIDTVSDSIITTFSGLTDTPDGYTGNAGKHVMVNTAETGLEFVAPMSHPNSLQFSATPTYNGDIPLLGWYSLSDTAVSLSSGSPVTASLRGFHSHFVLDVSNVTGAPFTITASGTTVNEVSGVYSQESESITISGAAFYQTSKSFIDAPIFDIVEAAKSCDIDIHKTTYWDFANRDFTVTGCRFEWTPDQNNWRINVKIYHHLDSGGMDLIDDISFNHTDAVLRAAANESGKYKRIDYDRFVNGSGNEGIVLSVYQEGIGSFYFEMRYETVIG